MQLRPDAGMQDELVSDTGCSMSSHLQCSPNTSNSPPRILSKKRCDSPGKDTMIRDPRLSNVRSLSSDIFAVIQADTTDSEGCQFNTGRKRKDRRESKHNKYASTQATEKWKLEVQINNTRSRTNHDGASRLVSELLLPGCLSILRPEGNGLFDQAVSRYNES